MIQLKEGDFRTKQLALVKDNTAHIETKKKTEAALLQAQKKASDLALSNKTLLVRVKELEKKINTIYRASL